MTGMLGVASTTRRWAVAPHPHNAPTKQRKLRPPTHPISKNTDSMETARGAA